MRYLALLLLFVVPSNCLGAETFIVTTKGIWRIDDGIPVRISNASDRIVIDGVDEPDDPDPDPPPADVVGKVKELSKRHLRTELEARAISSIVQVFRRDDIDLSQSRSGLRVAVGLMQPAFDGNQFEEWLTGIEALHQGPYTSEFIASIDKGISEAFGGENGQMNDTDIERILKLAREAERLDIIRIFEIIERIIKLLMDLGILGAGS